MSDNDSGFGFDPQDFANIPLFKELSKLMSWQGGAVNWDFARQTAAGIAGEPRLAIGVDADGEAWADAVRVAESWLDPHTTLDAVPGPALALTAQEWVERAAGPGGIAVYVEPIATGMQKALAEGLADQLPGGMAGLGGMSGAMNPITAMLTGMQVGTIAGHLADQLLGSYSLTVPTLPTNIVATVGDQAGLLARSHDISSDEMRFWLALRECIHRRVFEGAEWVMPHLTQQMEEFAAAAEFDPSGLVEQMGGLGNLGPEMLSDPEAMQRMAEEAGAGIEPSDRQRDILARLQALVSLIAGYADVLVDRAGTGKLPNLERIEAATLTERGQQGKGEQFLTQLVGLDLRPADIGAGRVFCEAVLAARGPQGLDVVWSDAVHLPTPAEIAEPSRWLLRLAADEATGAISVEEAASGQDVLEDLEVPDDLAGLDDL
ncbi:zinc-dependent metalloprotease [Euzebya tangerina]|uniref:zinc-dependent metalloprotease n=1 Tax=Euzebya tangerina TaxID=591198 RepID=UPI0013C2D990|nr:zinc-dependent metalloprotease [Euzebya tangerina]